MDRGLIKISVGYIHYRVTGQGKPIILLHPGHRSSTLFLKLMDVLGRQLRVFALDYPSYGMSDHVAGQPTISDYAKWVIEFMDGVGVEKASFLSEVSPAYLNIELANTYPERVEKIILVDCPFWPDKEFNRMRHAPVKGEQHPADATGFPLPRTLEFALEKDPEHMPLYPTQSYIDILNVDLILSGRDRWQMLNAVDEYDWAPALERLQCAVLLIWGEHFFYLRFRDEVTRRIKNHRVVVIKDGRNHVTWEHPEKVGQATLEFLA